MAHFISTLLLTAGNDTNGNSRRAIVVLLNGGIACAFREEGGGPEHTIRETLPTSGNALAFLAGLVRFEVAPSQYREVIKENPVKTDTDARLAQALGLAPATLGDLILRGS